MADAGRGENTLHIPTSAGYSFANRSMSKGL